MADALYRLQNVLSRLPGIGKRSAERIALRLIQDHSGQLSRELQGSLEQVEKEICLCERCGYVTSHEANPCALCTDPERAGSTLCLVEDISDITLMEESRAYRGRYFCLLGKLSPQSGKTLQTDRLRLLNQRIQTEGFEEILLALNADVESEATVAYLREFLSTQSVKVTRLALGIPAGSGIAYADPVTLARAVEGRTEIDA